ncbi:MAG: tetratricopeptide repeat protein [Candidatus Ozemobacteraceae bacterium]
MMKKNGCFLLFVLFAFLFSMSCPVFALKNICPNCNTMADEKDSVCKKCSRPLNQCLDCGMQNIVTADACASCSADLAEMRVLGNIDPQVRDDLRLGQSDRAQLERALMRLDNLLEKQPEQAEMFLYRKAKTLQQLKFWPRAVEAWRMYLKRFPATSRKAKIDAYLSECFRQWGYLFYQQDQAELALEKFNAAVKANPMNAEAWRWVARVENEKNNKAKAADAYLEALKAEPGDKVTISFLKELKKPIPANLLKPLPKPVTPPPAAVAPEAAPQKTSSPAPVSPAEIVVGAPPAPDSASSVATSPSGASDNSSKTTDINGSKAQPDAATTSVPAPKKESRRKKN